MEIIFRQDARAIIIRGQKVLTCQLIGRHSFYPGGGIDFGERATDALLRELHEELGITARIIEFLGVYEWLWNEENGQPHHNMSYFFAVESDELNSEEDPTAREPHLAFRWATLDQLAGWPVFPEPVHLLVQAVMNGERRPWWCSEVKSVDLL